MTEHCNLCNFMATAYENLVTHLKLAIRQLRELVTKTESSVDEDELLEFRVRGEIKHPWAKWRNAAGETRRNRLHLDSEFFKICEMLVLMRCNYSCVRPNVFRMTS